MSQLNQILKDHQLKATPARLGILRILDSCSHPLDVRKVLSSLHDQEVAVDQATVYRVLELLVQKNIAKRIDLHEGKFRYELSGSHHHHLICQHCGRIEPVFMKHLEKIEKQIENQHQFLIKDHSLEFFGLCKSCCN